MPIKTSMNTEYKIKKGTINSINPKVNNVAIISN
jgi:hypothetical protein